MASSAFDNRLFRTPWMQALFFKTFVHTPRRPTTANFSAESVLRAYKRQPVIEKRFSQLKTDFALTPMHLKDIARIQRMLAAYFFVLVIQTLLERELRQAMAREGLKSLPLYPEGRPCPRPTAQRVIEIFESIQRHVLTATQSDEPELEHDARVMVTELTPVQRRIVELLGLSPDIYGR